MVHGGYGKRRVAPGRRSKAMGVVEKKAKPKPKAKPVSFKNQIRSIERMLRKEVPPEVRQAQEKKLEDIKKQQEVHTRLAMEKKIFLRGRKIKFFERRKIERRIRRLEKQQRSLSGQAQEAQVGEQLAKLKEDLEYVRFYPKTEKYVSLFTGGEDSDLMDSRNRMRKQIKANLIVAAASGKELEETGSEDDGALDLSEDNFFLGSSSDEGDADDEWTDKSAREQCSSASGKAASGMSSDERNQKQVSARALMPPPRPSKNQVHTRFGASSSKSSLKQRAKTSSSSSSSYSLGHRSGSSSKDYVKINTNRRSNLSSSSDGHQPHTSQSNLSSNSDAHKPKRKRRPKKKKQQA